MYDWNQFYVFSKKLNEDISFFCDDIHTKHRVIMSRTYYAAYHKAKTFVKENKLDTVYVGGEHERIVLALKRANKGGASFKRSCHQLGNLLERLKLNRHKADYRDDIDFTAREVIDQIIKTKEVIDKIEIL